MIGWSFVLGRAVIVDEPDTQPAPEVIDEFVETYVAWREETASVRTAYERWLDGPEEDRRLAFASYQAALDREEQAARTHSRLCDLLRRGGSRCAAT